MLLQGLCILFLLPSSGLVMQILRRQRSQRNLVTSLLFVRSFFASCIISCLIRVVLLLDNQNERVQKVFEYIHTVVGEMNVAITLKITPPLDGQLLFSLFSLFIKFRYNFIGSDDYSVTALGSFDDSDNIFLGLFIKLNPSYSNRFSQSEV